MFLEIGFIKWEQNYRCPGGTYIDNDYINVKKSYKYDNEFKLKADRKHKT